MIRFAITVMLMAAMIVGLVYATSLTMVFHQLEKLTGLLLSSTVSGLPAGVAETAAPVAATLFAVPVTGLAFRLALNWRLRHALAATALAAASVGAWLFVTRDALFGIDGQPLRYVCPPTYPGAPMRVQSRPGDMELGGQCPHVNREIAAIIAAQRSSAVPERISVEHSREVDELVLYQQGRPVIFAGDPEVPGGSPRLFRNGGLDPKTAKWLRPATDQDLQQVREALVSAERRAQVGGQQRRVAAGGTVGERERELQVARAKREVDTRRAEVDADAKRSEEESTGSTWRKYFTTDFSESVPMVVVYDSHHTDAENAISGEVSGGRWYEAKYAKKELHEELGHEDFVRNPYRPLSKEIFPPGLGKLVVARVDRVEYEQLAVGEVLYRLRVVHLTFVVLDLKTWTATQSRRRIYA